MTPAEQERAAVVADRFWAKVEKRGPDDCWLWQGALSPKDGRGRFWTGKRQLTASRYALILKIGEEALGDRLACHTCDNPRCVNPAHLWAGTARDNTLDARAKGRLAGMSLTHCPRGHEYTPENTFKRRGQRECRTCRNARVRAAQHGVSVEAVLAGELEKDDCGNGHSLAPENRITKRKPGYTYTVCRLCNAENQRRYRQSRQRREHLSNEAKGG